jgi:hypothetical protein
LVWEWRIGVRAKNGDAKAKDVDYNTELYGMESSAKVGTLGERRWSYRSEYPYFSGHAHPAASYRDARQGGMNGEKKHGRNIKKHKVKKTR